MLCIRNWGGVTVWRGRWVALLLIAAGPAAGSAPPPEPAVIAIVGPMVGTSTSIGTQFRIGVEAAVAAIGPDGLLGRPLALQGFDDGCGVPLATAIAAKVVALKPVVVIGHSCSGTTAATPTAI
jgi:branched-chain amino acid transport system substrate-binding protein